MYTTKIISHLGAREPILNSENVYIGEDISIYPVGFKNETPLAKKIFRDDREPAPDDFTEEDLEVISSLLW